MTAAISHRGPDDSDCWVDARAGVALGHARLAIIDLSEAGRQPMASGNSRFVITYNGEIYNYRAVRAELAEHGVAFRGHSDTEVLVEAIAKWGLSQALEAVNGMFAFGLWDRVENRLTLARDRLGEKPLYYSISNENVVFASDLAAIERHHACARRVNPDALALLLRYNNIPAPWSIYADVHKLPPASVVSIECRPASVIADAPRPFWSIPTPSSAHGEVSDGELVERVEALLLDSVRMRLESDVPVGAFLSGGVDSSTIVAMMKRATNARVRTFTIGSSSPSHDEAADARRVADHLGTEHSSLEVSAQDALDVVPRLPEIFAEPFADASQIPTFLVSELARSQVTVCLSGDGGDEVFGGYNRHRWVPTVWQRTHRLPLWVKRAGARALLAVPPTAWRIAAQTIPVRHAPRELDNKARKLARVLDAPSDWAMYQRLLSHWHEPAGVVIGSSEPRTLGTAEEVAKTDELTAAMMAADLRLYLPDDILVKVDRASMAVSLEARVPMLDHRLVELAIDLPDRAKVRGRTTKWVLRQVLEKYVPKSLIDRPKTGFGIPIAEWLRGPLKAWAEDLLDESLIRQQGYFRPEPIRAVWRAHSAGRENRAHDLWCILMFQQWLDRK